MNGDELLEALDAIVGEGHALSPDVRVADVARKYRLHLNQLYTWCRSFGSNLPTIAGNAIVPIEIREESLQPEIRSDRDVMEIAVPGGLRIAVPLSADEAALHRLFSALRRSS